MFYNAVNKRTDLLPLLSLNSLAVALAKGLELTGLTDLNLGSNEIFDNGAVALAGALQATTRMTSLKLNDNWIGDPGAVAITKALEVTTTITKAREVTTRVTEFDLSNQRS